MRPPDPASPLPAGPSDGPDACLNCEVPLTGPYCSACGQKAVDPRETLRAILHDALGDVIAWDTRVLRTLRRLITSPGFLSREWAAGRRARYVPPFRLYVWLTLVLIGSNAIQRQATALLHEHEGPTHEASAPFGPLQAGTPFARTGEIVKAVLDVWLRNFFVTTPLIGFFFYVFFRDRISTYPPHFVLGLELASFGVLVLLAYRWVRILWVLVPPHVPFRESLGLGAGGVTAGILLAVLAISTVGIRRFYGLRWWAALAASPLLILAPLTVLVAVSFTVTFAVLLFG